MMSQSLSILKQASNLEQLPLDNYQVSFETPTDQVKQYLINHPNLSGVMIVQHQKVIGSITRRALFEKLSKEFSYALYGAKAIGFMLNNLNEDVLKVPAQTSITDAVKLSFTRPAKSVYDPIVVIKNGQEVGMLDFSQLILAQSELFSSMNYQLTEQEQKLRNYTERLQEQEKNVRQYASQLESQRKDLKQHNDLLERQKAELHQKTEELSRKSQELSQKAEELLQQKAEISLLNQRFEEVGLLVSQEGEHTVKELTQGVDSVLHLTEKINEVSNDFQQKLISIDQGNELINKVSKRVENLSFQASIIGSSLPLDENNKVPFKMIIEEIEKLSVQILEANTTINTIAKELRSRIKLLNQIAGENQEVVDRLAQCSQKTENALSSLAQLL
ncbi:MAG: hypothetical protein ACKOX2_19930 [Microcystaceae cyanobacterium]